MKSWERDQLYNLPLLSQREEAARHDRIRVIRPTFVWDRSEFVGMHGDESLKHKTAMSTSTSAAMSCCRWDTSR